MATVNFKYSYPYAGYSANAKYAHQWSGSKVTLNGCNVYTMVFNTKVPKCNHINLDIDITNTGTGNVCGISWDFFVYRQSYGWYRITTFKLPSDGIYTLDCDISGYAITQFTCVPSTNPGSNRKWEAWFNVNEMVITESLEVQEFQTNAFQYGLFVNESSVHPRINQTFANINGTIVPATGIYANIDDVLVPVQNVSSYHYTTEKETMALFTFTPEASGNYKIQVKRLSGDHEIRLYSSDFQELYDGYFYDRSFELTAETLYYITLTHYYDADMSDSYLQIYKEE